MTVLATVSTGRRNTLASVVFMVPERGSRRKALMGAGPFVPANTLASQFVPEKIACSWASVASAAPFSPVLMVELRLNRNTIGAAPKLITSNAGMAVFVNGSCPLLLAASGFAVDVEKPLWMGLPTPLAKEMLANVGQVPVGLVGEPRP